MRTVRRGGTAHAALILVAMLLEGGPAFGEMLDRYDVAEGCPTREQAKARLDAHLDRTTLIDPPTFTITVKSGPAEYIGVLETTQSSGTKQRRELANPTCADVVWSLVFVAALAVSPDARPLPVPPPVEPSSPNLASAPEVLEVTTPLAESPARPPTEDTARTRVAPAPALPRGREWSVEAGPELRIGALPTLGFGAAARGGYDVVALGASVVTSQSEALATGRSSFWMVTLRPQLCPLRLGLEARLEACGGLDVGALNASSNGLEGARDVTALWLAADVMMRARVALGGSLFIAMELRGGVPFHRPTYITNPPKNEVYEVPIVVGAAGISAGLAWP